MRLAALHPGTQAAAAQARGYRPDIDGLRALAVLAVLAYHAFPAVLPGGFVGVDVFFVISGYLISGILSGELDAGRFSLACFYGRRVRRIFPALCLVLASCLAYGCVVLLPSELSRLGEHVAGGAGFVANLMFWHEAGYFDRTAAAKPLLHLWSLGVEEQFYLAWPLLLWGAHRARLHRTACILALAGASFALNLVAAEQDAAGDFYAPATRMWELAVGALVSEESSSFLKKRTKKLLLLAYPSVERSATARAKAFCFFFSKKKALLPSFLGLVLILAAAALLNARMIFPGWLALLPVSGAALLIAAGPNAPVNRWLSRPAAVSVGLISYPLYLWHWPLLSYATILRRGRPPTPLMAAGLLCVAAGLAWLTWRYLEAPMRRPGARGRKTAWLAVLMAAVGTAGLGVWASIAASRGGNGLDVAKIDAAIREGIFRPTPDMQVHREDGITVARIGDGAQSVLFTGDSLMFHYGPRVQALYEQHRLARTVYFVVGPSCSPVPGIRKPDLLAQCSKMPDIAERLIAAHHVATVVFGAYWPGNHGPEITVTRGGQRLPLTSAAAGALMAANFEDELRRLTTTGHKVFVVLSSPWGDKFDPEAMIARSLTGYRVDPDLLAGVPNASLDLTENTWLRQVARRAGAVTLDPVPDICGTGANCKLFYGDGEPVFADEKHLRPGFVRGHIRMFDDVLTK